MHFFNDSENNTKIESAVIMHPKPAVTDKYWVQLELIWFILYIPNNLYSCQFKSSSEWCVTIQQNMVENLFHGVDLTSGINNISCWIQQGLLV